MPRAPFIPVVPAGGSGTRLWPLSRRSHPKFLLDLTGQGRSLLQATLERLAPLADRAPLIVTGAAHEAAVQQQVDALAAGGDVPGARVIAEPSPRNSMPAIALAAALAEREDPDSVIGSFAADHLIEDRVAFAEAVARARAAAEQGYLVTLGIAPTHAATGFGYIEQGDAADGTPLPEGVHPVHRFVEKPDREQAEEFLATGRFLWNAGMFVVRAGVLLDELAAQIPALSAGARELAAAHGGEQWGEAMARIWPTLTSIAIDHALAEPLAAAGRLVVVPAHFGWDDVGDFAALARQLRERPAPASVPAAGAAGVRSVGSEATGADGDVRVLGGAEVDALSSRATVYGATDRHIALVGVEGISIVDTEDVLLVLADTHAQELSALVARLEETGRGHLR